MRASTIILLFLTVVISPVSVPAQEAADERALHHLFGEQPLNQNALEICKQASKLSPDQRFELLAHWVLPNERQPAFRLAGDYHSTQPAPPVDFQAALKNRDETASTVIQYLQGKEALAIPAMELIDAAVASGQLRELRNRVLSSTPSDIEQQRSKLALLFLIEVARKEYPAAEQVFNQFVSLNHDADRQDLTVRWRDLLIMWRAYSDDRGRRIAGDYFLTLYADLGTYYPDQRYDVITDYLRVLQGLYHHLESDDVTKTVISESSGGTAEFVPFGFASAFNHGRGRPTAMWALNRNEAAKIAGHETDYLSYRVPLHGNYVVDADLNGGGNVQNSFMAAGTRAEYISYNKTLNFGEFRFGAERQELDIPGFGYKDWVRHRAVIRDGALTHFIDGREVFRKKISPHHAPWVAVANWRRSQGGFRNLRIYGEPEIPVELHLTADPELAGWVPYYEGGFGDVKSNWSQSNEPDGSYGLVGTRRPELAGAGSEELIRYIRPMAEGGTVEYDFFYQAGVSDVHPAIDRLAFLLRPDGVRIHWVTDGKFDRSGLDPLNESCEPQNQRGPETLPIIQSGWNHVRLNLDGDDVHLSLNGQLVYERKLEPGNRRAFGLFHFSGETEARARNVVWRGNWPNELPPPAKRQLAHSVTDELDARRDQLPATFVHDFRNGIPGELFAVEGNASNLRVVERGVAISNVDGAGVQALCTCLQIGGDYDIILAFEDLDIDMPVSNERAGIGLMTQLHNLTEDSCAMYRRSESSENNQRAAFAHKAVQPNGSLLYTAGGHLIEGATAGRLRLVRRGTTVYGLIAEYDSPNYRLVFQHDAEDDDVAPQGLRVVTQCAKDLRVAAILTGLDVRAGRIYGLPIEKSEPILKRLEEGRAKFQKRTLDFAMPGTFQQQFVPLGNAGQNLESTTDGARLKVTSTAVTTQARYYSTSLSRPIFDVAADLKIRQIDTPAVMGRHSEVVLEALLRQDPADPLAPMEAALILRLRANGVKELIARVYRPRRGNGITYLPIRSMPVKSPEKLRIAIEGKTIYFLYTDAGSDELKVLAEYRVDSDTSIRDVMLNVQASGKDRLTDVTWKSLTIHERQNDLEPQQIPDNE